MEDQLIPDENALVIPDAWLPSLHPRRGGVAVPEPAISQSAAKRVADKVAKGASGIEQALSSAESDPELAARGRAHLDGTADPAGAAVVAGLSGDQGTYWDDPRGAYTFVDAWVAAHGAAFAARAFAEMCDLAVGLEYGYAHRPLWVRPWNVGLNRPWARFERQAGRRVRAFLAAADEAEHVRAEAGLADFRSTRRRRLVAAYLMPSRRDWVKECLAEPLDDILEQEMLLCSVTAEHLDALDGRLSGTWADDVVYTLVEGAGTRAAPLLAAVADLGFERGPALEALAVLPSDEAQALLVDRIEQHDVRDALLAAAERFPVRTTCVLARAAAPRAGELLTAILRLGPDLSALPADVREVADALAAADVRVEEAPPGALPGLLVDPPWTRRDEQAEPVVIKGLAPPDGRTVRWADGERERWARSDRFRDRVDEDIDWAGRLDLFRERRGSISDLFEAAVHAPDELVRPLLPEWGRYYVWQPHDRIKPVAARFEADALPLLVHVARENSTGNAGLLLPFLDAPVARLMAEWNRRRKTTRAVAREWFGRHGVAAVPMLVPAAVGKPGPGRLDAEAALRLVASLHGTEAVVEAARPHGDEAADVVAELLSVDPAGVLPAERPMPPIWAGAHLLPQVLLREREHALPLKAVDHLVTMLAASQPGEVHPGVETVQELCDPASLAEFAWAVFEEWRSAGMPPEHAWALHGLGWLGDDETVRRLTPVIRAWPGEGGHHRAVAGLDVLASIGSDTALLHLHGIAQRVKFKGLKSRAQEKIAEVAAGLGLGPEELADRLVPDFGLDADGSLTLDYGPRRFTVGFDEQLKPFVMDEDGKARKALPKPGAKDDDKLAPEAHKRFAGLKKDVRTVAADQIKRLESAMLTGRRWPPEEFRRFFVDHPLMWHIARRLVWTAEDPATGTAVAFRIAEDRTLAGVDDEVLTLPEPSRIGVPHPLNLAERERAAWADILSDYEIMQPFPQLGRTVHALTDEERASGRLERFEGFTVPVHAVLGLVRRGWDRGVPLDAGGERWISRKVAPDRYVIIDLKYGITVGDVEGSGPQTLEYVWIGDRPQDFHRGRGTPHTFGELDPLIASEVLDDLTHLTATTEETGP
ncbi:hypothetical protein GCM10010191_94750 [Actinomadura vinacea]|uniref:DUF4132 domain-containing protein n=1 Tax=Actinomadura vinacea TaxID=115336 RepID=A0ABN3KJZ7_9ACTN